MTDELKPVKCGCGGEAEVKPLSFEVWDDRWDASASQYMARCDRCGMTTRLYDTEAEAITAWNRAMGAKDINVPDKERTAKVETYTDDQQETWSVCECGTDVWKSYNYCPECGAKLDWSEHE